MNSRARSKTLRRAVTLSALIGIATAAALVFRFPPSQYSFYPRCPIYEYLHLRCPGCGATRAFAALLHGHFAEAMHLNAFFVCIIPLLSGYAALSCYRAWTQDEYRWPELPAWVTYASLAIATIFAISRNLAG